MNWRERAIAQSRSVDRSRTRSLGTIENLVSSARALVIERAGGPFTTQELVERSGTSLQTIYRYFPSKDALLLAVFEEAVGQGARLIRAAVEAHDDPVDRFRALIAASLPEHPPTGFEMSAAVLVSVHTRLSSLFPSEVEEAQRGYVDLVREVLQAMIDADRIAPRNTLETDAQLITYLVRATYQAMITSGANDDRATVAHHVTAFCLHAVGLRDAIPRRPHAAPAERPTYRRHDGTTGVAAVSATDRGPR
jgi:AcrR family transcriptional regulator